MISLLLLALQATPAATAHLGCTLVTPGGQSVAFALEADRGGAAFLSPAAGSVWPQAALAGGGGMRGEGGKRKGEFHFGGKSDGVTLAIAGAGATLQLQGNRVPRAYGFCLPAAPASEPASASRLVSTRAAASIAPFDSASWPDEDCALLTRGGRKSRIGYSILGGGTHSEIKTADPNLFGTSRVVVRRTQGSGVARFGDRRGLQGAERLLTDRTSAEAVQLIDFAAVGVASAAPEPAVAICGHRSTVRRPAIR